MTIQVDELLVTEAVFNALCRKGSYDLETLQDTLLKRGIPCTTDVAIMDAIKTLVAASDLYELSESATSVTSHHSYIPLNPRSIESALPLSYRGKILIEHRFVTTSTNTDLAPLKLLPVGANSLAAIAVAEMQTGGKGRRAKRWVSPLAKNLYFSFKYHFSQSALPHLSALSLRAGIVLLDSLRRFGLIDAKLKWPNDIWVHGQKLAGILVESVIMQSGIEVIVGIGINNQYDRSLDIVGNNPTCCEKVLGAALDRNLLAAHLAAGLYQLCEQITYSAASLPDLVATWSQNSCFYGQKVRLHSDKEEVIGEEVGVDESGALLIRLPSGEVRALYSGDLSLRAYSY